MLEARWAQRANHDHKPSDLGSLSGMNPFLTVQTGLLIPVERLRKEEETERCVERGFAHAINVKRTGGSRPFVLAGCVWYFTGRLLMALVKKTSSQVLPAASRRSSVVMWLGDGALIDFKQIFLRLVG